MEAIRISSATPADVPVILSLIRELAEYEKLAHAVNATQDSLRAALFGARPAAEVLLAREGDQCLGFAVFFQNYSTFRGQPGLYLEDLYVKPLARGRGIGKALLARLASIATQRGYGRMEWTVLDWNQPAIGFYQRLGARVLPDWRLCRLDGDALVALSVDGQ
jgi:hypothetical protein